MADLLDRITINPNQCGGRPCIRGMRIRVTDVLDLLAGGQSPNEILDAYPYLEQDDIAAHECRGPAGQRAMADHAVEAGVERAEIFDPLDQPAARVRQAFFVIDPVPAWLLRRHAPAITLPPRAPRRSAGGS